MALTKAVVVKLDPPGAAPIPVMFNPPRYELSKTDQFAEIRVPGLPATVLQFVSGQATSLNMELFFDTTDSGIDVRERAGLITALAEPDMLTRSPPRLLLLWGSLAFPCFLVSVRQSFDYFDATGLPLRATLTVEFKGHDSAVQAPVAGPPAAESVTRYVAKAGDSVQSIAVSVYGDPGQWRRIAKANGVDDPRALAAGAQLQVPKWP